MKITGSLIVCVVGAGFTATALLVNPDPVPTSRPTKEHPMKKQFIIAVTALTALTACAESEAVVAQGGTPGVS